VARWNAHGIAGLVGVALVLAVLMVPRVLDLALRAATEAAKCAALLLRALRCACRGARRGWWCRASSSATCCP
jgi:hypothetical protein